MAKSSGDQNVVGYCKPPAASQFKPGQSGNPKGRPKGSKNLKTKISAELNRKILVTENGKSKRIAKGDALVRQVVNKALSGHAGMTRIVLSAVEEAKTTEIKKKSRKLLIISNGPAFPPHERTPETQFLRKNTIYENGVIIKEEIDESSRDIKTEQQARDRYSLFVNVHSANPRRNTT